MVWTLILEYYTSSSIKLKSSLKSIEGLGAINFSEVVFPAVKLHKSGGGVSEDLEAA